MIEKLQKEIESLSKKPSSRKVAKRTSRVKATRGVSVTSAAKTSVGDGTSGRAKGRPTRTSK